MYTLYYKTLINYTEAKPKPKPKPLLCVYFVEYNSLPSPISVEHWSTNGCYS